MVLRFSWFLWSWPAGVHGAKDTIKLGYLEALSGPFASAGDEALKIFGYVLDKVNAQGGALSKKFELVPFDDKLQPAEALIGLKAIASIEAEELIVGPDAIRTIRPPYKPRSSGSPCQLAAATRVGRALVQFRQSYRRSRPVED
jgi:hypothetical protein